MAYASWDQALEHCIRFGHEMIDLKGDPFSGAPGSIGYGAPGPVQGPVLRIPKGRTSQPQA